MEMPSLSCIPLLKMFRLTDSPDRRSGGSSLLTLPGSPLLCFSAEQCCRSPPKQVSPWTCKQSSPGSSRAPHTLGTYLGSWDDTFHRAGLTSACCWTDRAQLGTACASPVAQLVLQPPCPQSLGGSREDSRHFACPSSPGVGAWSQLQATQEPSS